jgi:ABC-2 type transport system ATP-binding protein
VDVELREELWAYVRELRESGTTIVLTTHYLEEAEQLADRIGVINSGKLVLLERRNELLNHYGERWLEVAFDRDVDPAVFEDTDCTRVERKGNRVLRFYFQDSTLRDSAAPLVIPGLLERFREESLVPVRIEGGRSRLEDIFKRVVGNDREHKEAL